MKAHGKLIICLGATAAAVLALSSCSSADDQDDAGAETQLENLLTADASADQQAAAAGTSKAMELGFDQIQTASDDDLDVVRQDAQERAGNVEDMTVTPESCAKPIAQLDWSPILADSESITRIDFGRSNFNGAGSIEVAGITEDTGGSPEATEQVASHLQAVTDITTDCNDITMMLADESEPDWAELEYTFNAEPIETDSGSGLLWQRYPSDDAEGQTTTAMTLMTQHEGYVVMVAFIGEKEIADDEFTDIGETVLSTAIAQLDEAA